MLINENQISLMQGRLTKPLYKPIQEFPVNGWREELDKILDLKLNKIEWIIDKLSFETNPLLHNNRDTENNLSKKNIEISAISNDYFLDLCNSFENILFSNIYESIVQQEELVYKLGEFKKYILVMPFIENATLKNLTPKEIEKIFDKLLNFESNNDLSFALELDIDFKDTITKLGDYLGNNLFINLDTGNTVSYGFNIFQEIEQLSNFIINVHLKDRKVNGPTVPLGMGDTNINEIIRSLKEIGYSSNYTLQFSRNYSDDVKSIKEYLENILSYD